jgi:hypothetical protein
MAGNMFGAPIGVSQAEADMRANKLAEMSLAKGAVEVQIAKANLDANKRMLEMMSQAASSPSTKNMDLADSMTSLAEMAMKAGLPAQAREFAETGSTLRRTTAEIDDKKFKQKMVHLNLLSGLMAGVKDQSSWDRANAAFKMQTGQDTPYAKVPYSPQVVQQIQSGLMTAKDRAAVDASKARQRASEAAAKEREVRIPLIKAQTEEVRARTVKLKKAGATGVIPKAADVKIIKDLIINEYGAGVMPEEASMLAQPVAERMVEILKDSNISRSQASQRAFQEAKANGHFGGLRPRILMKGTLNNPLDIPVTREGKADPTKLRTNLYYKGVGKFAGQTFLWNGKGFQKPVPVSEDEDGVTSEEENEDETSEDEAVEDEEREDETGGRYKPTDYLNPDDYNPEDYEEAQ